MIDCEHYQNYKGPNLTLADKFGEKVVKDKISQKI